MSLPADDLAPSATEEIVERCRRGEAAAWRDAFAEHAPYLLRVLGRLGVSPEDREDIVQEVFVVAHRRIHAFDGRSRLRTWLCGIALRVASQHRRWQMARRLRNTLWPDPPSPATPEDLAGASERRRVLHAALSRLSDAKRAVFVLYEIEGFEGEEIAEMVGCPLNTVWSRLRHARSEVEKLLARRLADPQGSRPDPWGPRRAS